MKPHGMDACALICCLALTLAGCGSAPTPANLEQSSATSARTPLIAAIEAGDLDRVQALVGRGQSLNVVTEKGTPLAVAVVGSHPRMAWYLLSEGASPDLAAEGQLTPLMLAAGSGQRRMVELLLSAGADVNARSAGGETPMTLAAMAGNLSVVKVLLAAGANVNVSQDGRSLLMRVVDHGDLLTAESLLAAGADVRYEDPEGRTALDLARRIHNHDLEMLLIQAGADS